jgi:serine/threonine protein kinase
MNLEDYIYRTEKIDFVVDAASRAFVSKDGPERVLYDNLLTIMIQITAGLEFIHEKSQVHRDLKPRNSSPSALTMLTLIVLYSCQEDIWKITDFGNTSIGDSMKNFTTSQSRGTPGYRAPELLRDESVYTNKVDIWALGCILYELACGRKAFSGDWTTLAYALDPNRRSLPFSTAFPTSVQKTIHSSFVPMLYLDPLKRPRVSSVNSAFQLMRDEDRQDELFDRTPTSTSTSNDTQTQARAEEKTLTAIVLYSYKQEEGDEIDLIEGETIHNLKATWEEVSILLLPEFNDNRDGLMAKHQEGQKEYFRAVMSKFGQVKRQMGLNRRMQPPCKLFQ